MVGQDNESYQIRVSRAVLAAVLEAGRAHPDARDLRVDVNPALAGLCEAVATFAATIAQLPEDREKAVALLGEMEAEIAAGLRFFAEKIRAGEFPPPERPKPRLVK
ncbi:MAG TPA: hypothetical protein VM662_16710 [Sphingomonas sp.]|nr:hypothetical protein [Sphingomonas sp.]